MMVSAFCNAVLAGALTMAFVGGVQAHSISYTVEPFSAFFVGSHFELNGTIFGAVTLNLTPGVRQTGFMDLSGTAVQSGAAIFTGTATSNVTINGVTRSVLDDFTFDNAALLLSFSGGAPVVFNLGTFGVTVIPIVSFGNRRADFLETLIVAPEPASLALFGTGLAGLGIVLRTRRG